MHDLNDALDELRSVIPYAHSPSVRKLSKIATLLLAKNYILMQASALDEMRRLVGYMNHAAPVAAVAAIAAGGSGGTCGGLPPKGLHAAGGGGGMHQQQPNPSATVPAGFDAYPTPFGPSRSGMATALAAAAAAGTGGMSAATAGLGLTGGGRSGRPPPLPSAPAPNDSKQDGR